MNLVHKKNLLLVLVTLLVLPFSSREGHAGVDQEYLNYTYCVDIFATDRYMKGDSFQSAFSYGVQTCEEELNIYTKLLVVRAAQKLGKKSYSKSEFESSRDGIVSRTFQRMKAEYQKVSR